MAGNIPSSADRTVRSVTTLSTVVWQLAVTRPASAQYETVRGYVWNGTGQIGYFLGLVTPLKQLVLYVLGYAWCDSDSLSQSKKGTKK